MSDDRVNDYILNRTDSAFLERGKRRALHEIKSILKRHLNEEEMTLLSFAFISGVNCAIEYRKEMSKDDGVCLCGHSNTQHNPRGGCRFCECD